MGTWVESDRNVKYPGNQGRTKLERLVFGFSMGFAALDRVPTILYTRQDSYLIYCTVHVENRIMHFVRKQHALKQSA